MVRGAAVRAWRSLWSSRTLKSNDDPPELSRSVLSASSTSFSPSRLVLLLIPQGGSYSADALKFLFLNKLAWPVRAIADRASVRPPVGRARTDA